MKHLQKWGPLVGIALIAIALLVIAPAVLSPFRLNDLGKYVCWAIAGVGIGLAWGRGGMLVMGQGVFFGLGGYAMAMHLKLADAAATGQTLPDFMQLYGTSDTLPWWWEPFANPVFALAMTVLLPMAVAAVLGFFVFRRTFDSQLGGFGGAPKFPRPSAFEFLLRYHRRTKNQEALDMVLLTLREMAKGGMNDQLGGGFRHQCPGSYQRTVFAQAMPGGKVRCDVQLRLQYRQRSQRYG